MGSISIILGFVVFNSAAEINIIFGKNVRLLQIESQFFTKSSAVIATGGSYAENIITTLSP